MRQKGIAHYLLLTISTIGFLVFVFFFFAKSKYISNSITLKNESVKKSDVNKLKIDMLSSHDPQVVIMGIALNYYPQNKLTLSNNGSYSFRFYGAKLTDVQYTKLVDYFQSIRQFPPMGFHLGNILHKDFAPLVGIQEPSWSPPWNKYWHESGYNLVTKNGFVCLYPFAETKIDGLWKPTFYDDQFIAPPPLVFRCSYFAEPSENNAQKVASFIKNFLTNENIGQLKEQDIIDSQLDKYLTEQSFSIPTYSASVGYTDRYDKLTSDLKRLLNSELDLVSQNFRNANWQAEVEETTNPKLIRNWYSLALTAKNQMYECQVDVDLWGDGYADYHPEEKILREKYPQYSDEEYEKNVLGGEIRRKIICFKSLNF